MRKKYNLSTCMVACDEQRLSFFLGLDGGGSWFQMVGIITYITEVMAIQKLSDTQLYKMHMARDL